MGQPSGHFSTVKSRRQNISLIKCPKKEMVPQRDKIDMIIHCAGNEVREEDSGTANGGSKKSKDFFH